MVLGVSFGSIYNPVINNGKNVINPESNSERLKNNVKRQNSFPVFPNELIGRSQVNISQKIPHELELSDNDKSFLSELSSDMYGFHGDTDSFWVHSKKQTKDNTIQVTMGDGQLAGKSCQDFVKDIVNSDTQAFQIAGSDKYGGNKLVTVVRNAKTNTTTMYTCDSKQCYPMLIHNDVDMKNIASAITDNLTSILGATVWKR